MLEKDKNIEKALQALDLEKNKILTQGSRVQGENPFLGGNAQGYGKSKYDEKASIKDIEEGLLNRTRATYQGPLEGIANTVVGMVPKVGLGILETVGNLADLENYAGALKISKTDYDNWFSKLMREGAEKIDEQFPVYLQNPGKAFDPTDSAWWIKSIGNVAESGLEFGLTGAGIGKLAGMSVNALKASINPVAKNMAKAISTTAQPLTTIGLTHAEGVLTGQQVFQDVYNKQIENGLSDEEAKNIAANSASLSVRLNYFTAALNYTSLNPFFRGSNATSKLVNEELKRLPKESLKDYSKRVAANYTPSIKRTVDTIKKEATQEAGEEWINIIAQNEGLYQGGAKEMEGDNFFSRALESAFSEEGLVSAGLGALGGAGQTALSTQLSKKSLSQMQDAWKVQRQVIVDNFGEDGITLSKDIKEAGVLHNELKKAVLNKDENKIDFIKSKLADSVDYRNIRSGTTKDLDDRYDEMLEKTYTDAGRQELIAEGIIENNSDTEIETLKEKINSRKKALKVNEKLYNSLDFKYSNRFENSSLNEALVSNLFDNRTTYNYLVNKGVELNKSKLNVVSSLQNTLDVLNIEQDNIEDGIFNPLDLKSYNKFYKSNIDKIKNLNEFKELEELNNQYKDISETIVELNDNYNKTISEENLSKLEKDYNDSLNKQNSEKEHNQKSEEHKATKAQEEVLAKQKAEEERIRKKTEEEAKKAAEEMQKKGSVEAAIFVKSDGSQQNIKRDQRFSVENDEFIIDDIQVDNGQITRVDLADNNGDEWSVDNQEQLSLMFDKAVFESTVPTEEQANIELVTNLKKAFEETDEDVSLEVNEDPSVNKPKLSELDKIERKRKALIDIIKAAGLPKTKFSFPEFWKKLLELPFEAINLNKQEFLTKNFLGIKDIINSIQRSNGNRDVAATTDEYLLNEDLTVYLPGSNEESPLPQGTPKEIYDLNTKINKGLIEKNITSGYKLTNGLSIARRDVDLELIGDEDGAVYKDAKKDGFFPNTILNFLNTELTPVGTKLIFRTASKYNDKYFDKNNKEQSYLDEWPIDIFVTIAGKEERVGTLHTPQYVNINNMAESLTEEELIDQANNLRAIRNEILNNSENDFESVITVKKDGFLNRNDYVHQKSLAKAFGTDKRIVLGVKVNSELFTSKEVENVQSNDFLVNGSTFIMVPDAKGVYVTRYVNKKQLKNNEVILNKLVSAFDKLMTTGIRDTNISKYLYTSNRNTLGLEGVMINSNNEVFINGTKFTEVNEDFKKALGNIYINISKDLIQNKAYLNEMFESGLLTTDIQQVKSEVNGKEVYSYFSQTTTEFANPAIAKTSKNTESTQKNDTSIIDNTEKSSNLTAEEIKNSIKNNFEQDFDEDINVEFNIKPSLEEENTIKEQKKNCK